jgi:serine/threonine protein kinase
LVPATILFIASDAVDLALQMRLVDGNSCPEFDRWLQLKQSGIAVDFRRIQRVGFDIPCFGDYTVKLSEFKEGSMIFDSDKVPNQIYHRIEDEFLVVVPSIPLVGYIEKSQIDEEIEKLVNLRHPCIIGPIGFVFPIESDSPQELNIIRLYCEGCSLAEVLSVRPEWSTSTVKAKIVVGIVLALRFADSLGLIHGHLTTNNICFDSDHNIQIVDFHPMLFEVWENEQGRQIEGLSRARWAPKIDVDAFLLILFEILVGRSATGELSLPTSIPAFISTIIRSGLYPTSETRHSFDEILRILKWNDFRIEDNVDPAEVSAFVNWVESAEHAEK